MDSMDRYKIQESIADAIAILDSVPMHRDLVPEANIVQLTSRVPIAHLAIERGLKALISEAGGTAGRTHALQKLCLNLKECGPSAADYLATAFEDAVKFYRYNVRAKGFTQFRSLDDYLSKVGTEKAFELFRYWAIGETGEGESPIPFISLLIHRELLRALWCLFLPTRRETVSERVENAVREAMFNKRGIHWSDGDARKERTVHWYMKWLLEEHVSCRSALQTAVQENFAIKDGDEFVSQTLRDAWTELQQTNDPAVVYFLGTLTYLPKGSQAQFTDAVPEVEWSGQDQTRGMMMTPGGTWLGFIEKYADSAWGITPSEDGPVQVTEIAASLKDAKAYLVNRLTRKVTVTVDGESTQLRIIRDKDFFPPPLWTPYIENLEGEPPRMPKYDLEFWDAQHGLRTRDEISVEFQSEAGSGFASVLQGTVAAVTEQRVSIAGMETFVSTETTES